MHKCWNSLNRPIVYFIDYFMHGVRDADDFFDSTEARADQLLPGYDEEEAQIQEPCGRSEGAGRVIFAYGVKLETVKRSSI